MATFLSDLLAFGTLSSLRQPPTLNAFGRGKIVHNAHCLKFVPFLAALVISPLSPYPPVSLQVQTTKLFMIKTKTQTAVINMLNRAFPHSASVRTNNSTRARLGWTFSYIYCIFVHPNLDSVPLFVGMRERSIAHFY